MKITLIGLGKMGSVLAKRLLAANFDLTVFNRSKEKMIPLINAGARPAESIEDAVREARIIITCLLDDKAVLETVKNFVHLLSPNVIHIGTSTIVPETSKKLLELHHQYNSIYIAANVLGVPKVAVRGELTTIVAGPEHVVEQCKSIFASYSNHIISVGTQPFQANAVKICMNYFLVTVIETLGELYTFAEKSQINPSILNPMFQSIFAHPAFLLYVDKVSQRDFDEVNFDIKGGYKDINLFQQAFAEVGVAPQIANIIKDKFIMALAHHMDDKDWSAITEITRLQANLQ